MLYVPCQILPTQRDENKNNTKETQTKPYQTKTTKPHHKKPKTKCKINQTNKQNHQLAHRYTL